MGEYYRLEGREVVTCTMEEWAKAYANPARRRVAETTVKDVWISTVFLGTNHNVGGGPPLIFETMVFGGQLDQDCERCSTVEEAEAQHVDIVRRVREAEMSPLERAVKEVRDGHK